jgi:hypothetical protein|tara:strand:+ start:2069 stop:2275 length:207 start_codon:yes stop_codon:yes gene_type:complete
MTKRRTDNGQFIDVGKYRAMVGISVGNTDYEAGKNYDFKDIKAVTIKQLIKDGSIMEVDENGDLDGES